jgi:predicted ABC-type ATPase
MRINKLVENGENFAFETTLSTKSYVQFIAKAKSLGYRVTCLFFWLNSEELAVSRVKTRVEEGGHNIPEEVILRRYRSGLRNFFNLFLPKFDNWLLVNNSGPNYEIVADGSSAETTIHDPTLWNAIKQKNDGN